MTPKQIADIVCTEEPIRNMYYNNYSVEFKSPLDQDAFWQLCKENGYTVTTIDQYPCFYVVWSE